MSHKNLTVWVFLISGCILQNHAMVARNKVRGTGIERVHIISMNHLDVGYADLVNNILNEYFTKYFDRAAHLAQELREGGYEETFIYTTHPWLVSLYLDCPPNLTLANVTLKCPNATALANFTAAVHRGDITWHAGPMNMQMENLDQSLLEFGLRMGDDLDKRFNITRPLKVLSQRDVPGMTQAVIPSLVKMGISGVSVGVNTMTPPPAVPNPFRWKYGNYSIIGTWHKGGYPNNYGPDPAHPGGISLDDCLVVDGIADALCFAFRTDNSGPPVDIQEIFGYYRILRKEFPGAKLMASTLENYFASLQKVQDSLPVLETEIGDTWIQGVSSDPRKLAEYRAVRKVFSDCVQSGSCSYSDAKFYNASRFLLKLGEHTLGLDNVRDTYNWTNEAFTKAEKGANFKRCEASWIEQRAFVRLAVDALGNHSVVPYVNAAIADLSATSPDLTDFAQVPTDPSNVYTCGELKIAFSMEGSLSRFSYGGKEWADSSHPLGLFRYVTYNETDFDRFGELYNYNGYSAGYTKYNVTPNAHPESRHWPLSMDALYQKKGVMCEFYAHVKTLDSRPRKYYGAPADVWIHYKPIPEGKGSKPGLEITLQWFDKMSTRLPEALFLGFLPAPQPNHAFKLLKLGRLVSPTNVILNGSQYQHAVDEGFYYVDQSTLSGMKVTTYDVSIVSVTTADNPATVFPAPLSPIKANITGMEFNFYNNIWDTNFIFWYPYMDEDADFKARFSIEFTKIE